MVVDGFGRLVAAEVGLDGLGAVWAIGSTPSRTGGGLPATDSRSLATWSWPSPVGTV